MINNKGFVGIGLIVAIVLGAIVVGGGAYYLGKNKGADQKAEEKINDENQAESNQIIKAETVSPNALAYKGDGFTAISPYSLDYVTTSKEPNFSSSINFNNGDCESTECSTAVKIYIKDGLADKKAYDAFIEQFLNNFSSKNIIFPSRDKITTTKVTVDNEPAVQYSFESFAGGYNGIVYITAFFHNGKGYIVRQKEATISKFLPSFKFNTSEESITEVFSQQPGEIKSIKSDGTNKWVLAVDLLTYNPNWLPGSDDDISGPFFLNQNTKIRNLSVTDLTKTYKCGNSEDDNIIKVLTNTSDFIQKIKSDSYKNRYFDITGTNITAIYEQCLP